MRLWTVENLINCQLIGCCWLSKASAVQKKLKSRLLRNRRLRRMRAPKEAMFFWFSPTSSTCIPIVCCTRIIITIRYKSQWIVLIGWVKLDSRILHFNFQQFENHFILCWVSYFFFYSLFRVACRLLLHLDVNCTENETKKKPSALAPNGFFIFSYITTIWLFVFVSCLLLWISIQYTKPVH